MFKKKLITLLYEEEKTLIRNNPELLENLRESHIESGGFWLDEYLRDCAGCDYSISYGYSYRDYFKIKDVETAGAWLEEIQRVYCFLSETNYKTITEFINFSGVYNHVYELFHYGYSGYTGKYGLVCDADYYNVERKYNNLKQQAEDIIFKRLREEVDYWFNDENVIDCGLEEYLMDNADAENLYTDL